MDIVQNVSVSIKNTETFQQAIIGGDETSAAITVQAKHFSMSQIRHDSTTGFIATFVYQPAPGFIGSDDAEVQASDNSDGGVGPPKLVKTFVFHFVVHD